MFSKPPPKPQDNHLFSIKFICDFHRKTPKSICCFLSDTHTTFSNLVVLSCQQNWAPGVVLFTHIFSFFFH